MTTPLMAGWHTILGAMQQVSGGQPLMGSSWQNIHSGQVAPGGQPGNVGHGPYGDPHGARGHHHHRDRHGLPPVGWHNSPGAEYGIAPAAVLVPAPAPTQAQRQGLPMNSGQQTFAFSDTALITSRPQRPAFRPERVFISPAIGATAGAAAWFVNDITIGNVSQLVQSGGLPGDMFANQSIDSFVTFATAQTAMDVTMSITLIESGIEPNPAFYGGIIGTAAT